MIIKIPKYKISKIDIINIKGGISATQVYNKYRPDYMINLALYDMDTGTNITHLKDEKVSSGYLFSNEGIGIKDDNTLVWTNKDDTEVRDYVSGSPVLIKHSKRYIDWGNKVSTALGGSHYRSAIGFNDNELILYNSDKKATINQIQDDLLNEGCHYAINCDGGGSCHLQTSDKVLRKSSRKNASWLLVYLKQPDLVLTIDKKGYKVEGEIKTSDVAPKIENGRTMVPIYVLRDLGLIVDWNSETREVYVYK